MTSPGPGRTITDRNPISLSSRAVVDTNMQNTEASLQAPSVNPWLHVPYIKDQSKWVKMRLHEAHPEPARVEDVTMQSLLTKVEEVTKRRLGSIHILDAVFEEKDELVANVSEGSTAKMIDCTKICRPVNGTFERFLALVEDHREILMSDRGYITLTVAK